MAVEVSYVPALSKQTPILPSKTGKLKTRLPLPTPHKLRPTPLPNRRHPTFQPLLRPDHRALTERQLSSLVNSIVRIPVGESIEPVLTECQSHITQSILLQLVQALGRQGFPLRAAEAAVWARGQSRYNLDSRILAELASALRASGHADIAETAYGPPSRTSSKYSTVNHEDDIRLHRPSVRPSIQDPDATHCITARVLSSTNSVPVHGTNTVDHGLDCHLNNESIVSEGSLSVSSPSNDVSTGNRQPGDIPIQLEHVSPRPSTAISDPISASKDSAPPCSSSQNSVAKTRVNGKGVTLLDVCSETPFSQIPAGPSSGVEIRDNLSYVSRTAPVAIYNSGNHNQDTAADADCRPGRGVPGQGVPGQGVPREGGCAISERESGFRDDWERDRKRTLFDWTSLISSLAKEGEFGEVQVAYWRMLKGGGKPDPVLYRVMMQVYAKLEDVERATRILRQMQAVGFPPSLLEYNIMIELHCTMCNPDKAMKVLQAMMREGVAPTTTTFNLLATGFLDAGKHEQALRIVHSMGGRGAKADSGTYELLLKVYAGMRSFKEFDDVMEEMETKQFRLRPSDVVEIKRLYYEASRSITI